MALAVNVWKNLVFKTAAFKTLFLTKATNSKNATFFVLCKENRREFRIITELDSIF